MGYMSDHEAQEIPRPKVPTTPQTSGVNGDIWEIIKVIIVSLAIVLPIRYFLVQPFIVRGSSMEENFEDSDYLVIDELSYDFRVPARGDVIVFRYPLDPKEFFIKRVIGLPGEEVIIKNRHVTIKNTEFPRGFTLDEPYLTPPNRSTFGDTTITLAADEYFVLGDNRDASSDSRIWGPLPRKFITGHVVLRAWPVTKFGVNPGSNVPRP